MTTTSFVELPTGALRMPAARTNDLVLDVADPISPWRRVDLAISGLLLGAGLLGILGCWFVGSGELTYTDQVPWLVNSILCAVLSVSGLVYWLVRGFRQVNLMQRDVQRWLVPWVAEQHAALRTGDAVTASAGAMVSAPTMTRVHHAVCPMVRGKSDVAAVTDDEIRERGLTQCGACHRG